VAIDEAAALLALAPDREREGRLTIVRAHMRMGDALAFDEATIFAVVEMFRELGDPAGEARAWGALVTLNCGRSNRLKGGEAAERMLDCAKRAGSKGLVGQAMRNMGSNFALGSAPLKEAIPRVSALIAEAGDDYTKARLMNCLARLESIGGRFDEGRALLAKAREVCPVGERANLESYLLSGGAHIELYAGNPARAEELSRAACDDFEAQGLVRYLSSEMCFLIDALIGLGRFEEAEANLERARPWAAADDADALLRQARSWARLELARANLDAADAHVRESLSHVEAADAIDEHAEVLLLLATIRRASGDDDGARAAAAEALALSEERGHVVFAQQAREVLSAPVAVA
jgi:tetratricopeptide (TPR) repeat protein